MESTEISLYQDYKKALLEGKKAYCKDIIQQLIAEKADIKYIYLEFFQRSLYEVGELWESNQISVAREHLATSITTQLMTLMYPLIFSSPKNGKNAIITCIDSEHHQIGARMVADIFEISGWDTYYLGANTPVNELLRFLEKNLPDMLAVSLAIYSNYPHLLELLKQVHAQHPDLKIIAGGQAFRWAKKDLLEGFPQVEYIPTLEKLQGLLTSKHKAL